MCGLIGAVSNGSLFTIDIDRELERVAHRGPDSRGYIDTGDAVLGHTRLAIRDVREIAGQPMNARGINLTFNGELWNNNQLRARIGSDWQWETTSDTETVLAAIWKWREHALGHLDGMWAIVWRDDRGVWAARDPYGRVPLYTTAAGHWASERKALDGVSWPVRPGTVTNLLTGVTETYPVEPPVRVPATPASTLAALRRGVRDRLVSDRPVCFMLSGGLDSSLVLKLAIEEGASDPVAYTAVFDPDSADLAAARKIAAEYGVELREIRVPAVTPERVEEAVWTIESGMKAQVEIALAHLPLAEAMAADGYRVCLSGEAADELFGGYGNMMIRASTATDSEYNRIKHAAVAKMARGNFTRVNTVFMAHGVEGRLPFMDAGLVDMALRASKSESPPGKKLLKQAAEGVVPEWVIRRPKDTFQGGAGISTATADMFESPIKHYNRVSIDLFGYRPDSTNHGEVIA